MAVPMAQAVSGTLSARRATSPTPPPHCYGTAPAAAARRTHPLVSRHLWTPHSAPRHTAHVGIVCIAVMTVGDRGDRYGASAAVAPPTGLAASVSDRGTDVRSRTVASFVHYVDGRLRLCDTYWHLLRTPLQLEQGRSSVGASLARGIELPRAVARRQARFTLTLWARAEGELPGLCRASCAAMRRRCVVACGRGCGTTY